MFTLSYSSRLYLPWVKSSWAAVGLRLTLSTVGRSPPCWAAALICHHHFIARQPARYCTHTVLDCNRICHYLFINSKQQLLPAFQLLEYQWSEGKQTSSDPTRRFRQVYDWGNLNDHHHHLPHHLVAHYHHFHHHRHHDKRVLFFLSCRKSWLVDLYFSYGVQNLLN